MNSGSIEVAEVMNIAIGKKDGENDAEGCSLAGGGPFDPVDSAKLVMAGWSYEKSNIYGPQCFVFQFIKVMSY